MDGAVFEELEIVLLQRRPEEESADKDEEWHVEGIDEAPHGMIPKEIGRYLFCRMTQKDAENCEELQMVDVFNSFSHNDSV